MMRMARLKKANSFDRFKTRIVRFDLRKGRILWLETTFQFKILAVFMGFYKVTF